MEPLRRRRPSSNRAVSSSSSTSGEGTLLSPQEVIDSLGPDAFGNKEPEEGARELHKKLTDFADKSPELSPELVSEEAPEAFFLGAETKLKDVEADLAKPDSDATYDERIDFGKGVTFIHALFAGEEIPSVSPAYLTPEMEEAALEREKEEKIAKVIKQFSSPPSVA